MTIPHATAPGRLAVLALLGVGAFGPAFAQEADPPGRAARLSYFEGPVSLQPAGVQEWVGAELNRPLTTGDKLWTDQDAVAELDIGSAVIRLGSTTGVSFLNLDDNNAQMQLSVGTLIARVWDTYHGQSYEVDTPNLAVLLQQPGVYRVEVDGAGDTTVVKVTEGQALAASGGQTIPINAQQVATFTGTDPINYAAATLGSPDDLDDWANTRDRQAEESPSRQYVADDVAGSDDLDDNGRWQETPEYGYVWTPVVVPVGWVPYRTGHWLWIAPWGWTWVEEEPWGYAPFHYGRWVSWHGSWCWVPGPRSARPMYAPSLVAWTGRPGGNVGWFPLGPHEVYTPPYRASATYLRGVNVSNTTIVDTSYITRVYENRVTNIHYLNSTSTAVTAVPQGVFTSAQRVAGHTVSVPATALAVEAAAPAIAPLRQGVLGAPPGSRRIAQPPASIAGRRVVAHTPPPRASASFETQLAAIRANGGRPLAPGELTKLQPAAPLAAVRMAPTAGKFTAAVRSGGQALQSAPGLADRARVLSHSALPSSPGGGTFSVYTPLPHAASPPVSEDAPDRPVSVPQRAFAHDDPTHANGHPSAAQSHYSQTPVELRPEPAHATAGPARAVERPQYRAQQSRPSSQAQPAGKQSSREEAGAHADRSRDRTQR